MAQRDLVSIVDDLNRSPIGGDDMVNFGLHDASYGIDLSDDANGRREAPALFAKARRTIHAAPSFRARSSRTAAGLTAWRRWANSIGVKAAIEDRFPRRFERPTLLASLAKSLRGPGLRLLVRRVGPSTSRANRRP
jgi:hypothetical protein